MNIDILNANCGLGHSRGHACLRVGLKYLSRVADIRSRRGRLSAGRLILRCRDSMRVACEGRRVRLGRPVESSEMQTVRSVVHQSLTDETVARTRTMHAVVVCDRQATDDGSSVEPSSYLVLLFHSLRPEIRRDYPLNLSILISGGKETNQDSLSNGE